MAVPKISVLSQTAKDIELFLIPYDSSEFDGIDGVADCWIDMEGLANSFALRGKIQKKPIGGNDVFTIDSNGDGKFDDKDPFLYFENDKAQFGNLFADTSPSGTTALKTLKACVSDDISDAAIPGAKYFITTTAKTLSTAETEFSVGAEGCFTTNLPIGEYVARIEAPEYLTRAQHFSLSAGETHSSITLHKRPATSSVEIKDDKIEVSKKIHFESGNPKLATDSEQLLDEVADLLNKHPEIVKVQIGGHTDSVGSTNNNQKLSQKRADAVLRYLESRGGVNSSRLEAKGFGETDLLIKSETTEGDRKQNRRIEFKILDSITPPPAPAPTP